MNTIPTGVLHCLFCTPFFNRDALGRSFFLQQFYDFVKLSIHALLNKPMIIV